MFSLCSPFVEGGTYFPQMGGGVPTFPGLDGGAGYLPSGQGGTYLPQVWMGGVPTLGRYPPAKVGIPT